jgi:hypothetical protein
MGTVDNAHATILENIKGFEALKDGNYAVFEKFAFFVPALNMGLLLGIDLTRCHARINFDVHNLARANNLEGVPEITGSQINDVAIALNDRQKAIVDY